MIFDHFYFCSDEDKLKWAFRLYDMDNNGVIDMDEMAAIIETLDCIEGVKPGSSRIGLICVTEMAETLDCLVMILES